MYDGQVNEEDPYSVKHVGCPGGGYLTQEPGWWNGEACTGIVVMCSECDYCKTYRDLTRPTDMSNSRKEFNVYSGGEILNIRMQENDANAQTVRDYLRRLLRQVWMQQEEFSGKRPFGNSGWSWELVNALAAEGVVDNDDEHMTSYWISEAIRAM